MIIKIAPIRIGYTLSLTGPVAENAWSARVAHQLWQENINAKGGLLGRPVELTCYDDKADPALVSKLYEKLIKEDMVDLVIGGYGTNTLAASLPSVVKHGKFLVGLMGLGVNNNCQYPGYFAMIPTGPNPNASLTEGFFEIAAKQKPALKTIALLTADAEFSKNPVIGAKENALKYGQSIIYEETYPLSTEDFEPYIKALQKTNAEVLFLCSYLKDSIALIKAINASSYRPKIAGGAMIGPQTTTVKVTLGPLLNGFVNYDYWVPDDQLMFPGVVKMLEEYRARAGDGFGTADVLGHYVAPLAYSQLQVIEQAIMANETLDDNILIDYCRQNEFETVMGKVRFGKYGEWNVPRVLQVQYQNIKDYHAETFIKGSTQVILSPDKYVSGTFKEFVNYSKV